MADGDITQELIGIRSGTPGSMERLFTLVYEPLKAMARRKQWRGGRTPTLDATALVHEVYLRLVDQTRVEWRDRGHFFAVAARAMRQIAVDNERRRRAAKRGGGKIGSGGVDEPADRAVPLNDVLAVDRALERLTATSPRLVQVVELCFFAGMTTEEAAEALEVSPRTIDRDWQKAKLLLFELIHGRTSSAG